MAAEAEPVRLADEPVPLSDTGSWSAAFSTSAQGPRPSARRRSVLQAHPPYESLGEPVTRRRARRSVAVSQGPRRSCELWREGQLPAELLCCDNDLSFYTGLERVIAAALRDLQAEADAAGAAERQAAARERRGGSRRELSAAHFRLHVLQHEHAALQRLVERELFALHLCQQRARGAAAAAEAAKRTPLASVFAEARDRAAAVRRVHERIVRPFLGRDPEEAEGALCRAGSDELVEAPVPRRQSPLAFPGLREPKRRASTMTFHSCATDAGSQPSLPVAHAVPCGHTWQRALHTLLSHPQALEFSERCVAAEADLERRRCFEQINRTLGERRIQDDLRLVPKLLAGLGESPILRELRQTLEDPDSSFYGTISRFTQQLLMEARQSDVWSSVVRSPRARSPRRLSPRAEVTTPSSSRPGSPLLGAPGHNGVLEAELSESVRRLIQRVPEFVDNLSQEAMARYGGDSVQEQDVIELIESRVYPQLYDLCMFSCRLPEPDQALTEMCQRWQGLSQAQVYVPEDYHSRERVPYYDAISRLRTLPMCRTPTRKMQALRQAAQAVFRTMRDSARRAHPDRELVVGGDDFVPVFIYAVLKADVPQLASEVNFTYRFMHDALAQGEGGYYLTTMELALEYIKSLSPDSLALSAHSNGSSGEPLPYAPTFNSYGLPLEQQQERPCTFASPHVERMLLWARRTPTLDVVAEHGLVRGYRLVLVPCWLRNPARPYVAVCEPSPDPAAEIAVCVLRFTSLATEMQRLWLESLCFYPTVPGLRGVPMEVTARGEECSVRAHLLVLTDRPAFAAHAALPFSPAFSADEIARARSAKVPAAAPGGPAELRVLPGGSLDAQLPHIVSEENRKWLGCSSDAEAAARYRTADLFFAPDVMCGAAAAAVRDAQLSLQVLGLLIPLPHAVGCLCLATERAVALFAEELAGGRFAPCGAEAPAPPAPAGGLPPPTALRLRGLMRWLRGALERVGFALPEQPSVAAVVRAVRNFQSVASLRADGRCGAETIAHLSRLQTGPRGAVPPSPSRRAQRFVSLISEPQPGASPLAPVEVAVVLAT